MTHEQMRKLAIKRIEQNITMLGELKSTGYIGVDTGYAYESIYLASNLELITANEHGAYLDRIRELER